MDDAAGQPALLATKIAVPPGPPVLIPRSRLIAALGAGIQRPLVHVSAPAGFGKTTLLADWARRAERPVAWLSLDPDSRVKESGMSGQTEHGSGVVEICGVPLYYEIAGIGPPLVLIHEGLADSRMFDDQFEVLARSCRVVRYDMHGFGRSGTPVQAYAHHQALRDLLDHLGIERAAIMGMSLGGTVATDFALTHPAMVSALLLVASGLGGYQTREETVRLTAPIREAFQAGDFVRAIDLSVRFWVDGPGRQPEEVDPTARERFRALYTDVLRRSRERGRAPDPLDPPAMGRLGEIGVPTLVVVGSGDVPDVVEIADLLARGIPGARQVVIPRVAHLLNLEVPAEVNRLILDFLGLQPG